MRLWQLWCSDTVVLWYYQTMILWYYQPMKFCDHGREYESTKVQKYESMTTMILQYYDPRILWLWFFDTLVLWGHNTLRLWYNESKWYYICSCFEYAFVCHQRLYLLIVLLLLFSLLPFFIPLDQRTTREGIPGWSLFFPRKCKLVFQECFFSQEMHLFSQYHPCRNGAWANVPEASRAAFAVLHPTWRVPWRGFKPGVWLWSDGLVKAWTSWKLCQ